ncbi:MAG: peptidoglycan-binding protein [Clostridia bacterium]|nr:peptidoglycan-binding protein [Clostridia bacterium]MBQ2949089.1 peptidoglycan-binding protein [Clostridia bacterium]MBQ4609360.1 peptidoglycan-binding protein [Clostridia bacterium]MBQ6859597.1 peptidoglycan-binding protein [Clostridia bacterium]MBQ7053446.1 peptidoglycan-binding protein [Clostridia bacterium]
MTRIAAFVLACFALLLCGAASAQSYRYGDSAEEIETIQRALEELDYYYADITGHFGSKTEAAVRKFQRRHGLAQTGAADEQTLRILYREADVDLAVSEETGTGETEETPASQLLKKGSAGEAVRALQAALDELGYYHGTVTGRYGNLTKEAVRRFQRAHGLSSDGVAGPITLEKLREEAGTADEQTPVMELPQEETISVLSADRTLRRGERSADVRMLQRMLADLGYMDVEPTGYFGSMTDAAVRAFQRKKGLKQDGLAGRMTIAALNEEYGSRVISESLD